MSKINEEICCFLPQFFVVVAFSSWLLACPINFVKLVKIIILDYGYRFKQVIVLNG
jgi:hypothetical protein